MAFTSLVFRYFRSSRCHRGRVHKGASELPEKTMAVARNALSFDGLNSDCVVHILSFLPFEDMNSFAICSRHCRETRSNEFLDQTRTGTIVCSEAMSTTVTSFFFSLYAARNTFTVNHTCLKVIGLEKLENEFLARSMPPFLSVTCLELSLNPNERNGSTLIKNCPLMSLSRFLPNVRELILSDVGFHVDLGCFVRRLPNLKRVAWKGGMAGLEGANFGNSSQLTELFLDECRFVYSISDDQSRRTREALAMFSTDTAGGRNRYILRHCTNLEHLSIMGATWSTVGRDHQVAKNEPIPQEMLMKMVRCHPTLRWLRSDLTEENVDILKQERPEVAFVTD